MDYEIDARLAGYGWDEIGAFTDDRSRAAIDAGYSPEEIDAYLGREDAERAQARMNADWQARVAGDEQLATGLRSARHDVPLSTADALEAERVARYAGQDVPAAAGAFVETPPAGAVVLDEYARGSYADAFLRNEVRSPLEWAERYVGAAWNALGDADPAAMVRSVGQLAEDLPTPQELTDAAIALVRQTGEVTAEGVRYARAQIADAWAETGQPLMSIYERASNEPEYAAALAVPPQPEPEGPIEKALSAMLGMPMYLINEVWPRTVEGARDVVGEATQMASRLLPEEFTGAVNEANNYLSSLGLPLAEVPPGGIEAMERLRTEHAKAGGSDEDWWRWGGEVAVTVPMFTTFGLTGAWGLIAAGATGGAAAAAFHPSTAEDYWTEKAKEVAVGGALGAGIGAGLAGIGKVISKMAPQAADMLRNWVRRTDEPEIAVPDFERGVVEFKKFDEAFAEVKPAERVPPKPATAEGVAPEPVSPLEFVPEATPAQKIEALSRDWQAAKLGQRAEVLEELRLRNEGILPDEFGPDFFTRLAAKQDAETLALAEGMDAARGFMRYARDLIGPVLRDESGALNMGAILRDTLQTAQQQQRNAAYAEGRDFARRLMRQGMGEVNREEAMIARQFWKKAPNGQKTWYGADKTVNMYKLVQPHIAEFEAEIAKGPAGNVRATMLGNFIEYVEGRSLGMAMRHDSRLTPLADLIRDVNKGIEQQMRAAEAQGLHSLKSYYDDYFRHIWKDSNAVDKAFGVSRTGSSASFNLRTLPTTMDGLARGLEPRFTNPIELTLFDVGEKLRYLKTLEMLAEARNTRSPVTGQRIVYFAAKARNPGDMPLMGAGTRKVIPKAGMADLQAYAPPGFATNWNNTVGTGFFNREFSGKLFEQFMYIKNLATQTSLAGPIYHALSITEEVLASGLGNAAIELVGGQKFLFKGQLGKWAEEMGRGLYDLTTSVARVKAIENYIRGRAGIAAHEQGVSDPAIDILTKVNFRFNKHRQEMYKMGTAPSLWETVAKGDLGSEFWRQMKYLTGDPKTETMAYRAVRVPTTRLLGVVGYYAGKMWNTIAAPLFEHLIPIMKVGGGLEHMRTYLRQNPTATEAMKLARAQQISDTIDNRLGELNFDNVFWPRAVKQTLQAAMISPGWVYGEIRGFIGGAFQFNIERARFEWNPVQLASSVVGFTMAYMISNLGYQWIKSGTFPLTDPTATWKDAVVGGRTGGTTPQGADERALLPGKQKEIFDWGKIIATSLYDPWKTPGSVYHYLRGKEYSIPVAIEGLVTGKDRIGNVIKAQPGGYQAFLAKTLMPISMGTMAERKSWTGMAPVETFLGLRQVPTFAQDPEQFYKILEMVDRKNAQEQYRRVLRENRQLETPREVPERPPGTTAAGYNERPPTPRDENGIIIRPDGTPRPARGGGAPRSSYDYAGGDYGVLRGGGSTGTVDLGGQAVILRGQSRPPASARTGSAAYTPWRTRSRRQRSRRRGTLITVD